MFKSPVNLIQPIPVFGEPGYFATERKYDIHTGIDLYTNDNDPVHALYDGQIVNIEKFTGEHADSPWWENTFAVLIESPFGVILYGELIPLQSLQIGDNIIAGQLIGYVKRVLKNDKGRNPTSMLHLELYNKNTTNSCWWKLGETKPIGLLNPEILLIEDLNKINLNEIEINYNSIINSTSYKTISEYYGNKTANRSKVPLINHINEGIYIMSIYKLLHNLDDNFNYAIEAFCLHPIFQSDEDLRVNFSKSSEINSNIMTMVMEYRNIANAYLSHRQINSITEIKLSPIWQVNYMLIADKIQNYKDFLQYHRNNHERSAELDNYFNNWLDKLEIKSHFDLISNLIYIQFKN